MRLNTDEQIRQRFWDSHPEFDEDYNPSFEQNDYCADIRIAFTNFTEYLSNDGQITEEQADNITL